MDLFLRLSLILVVSIFAELIHCRYYRVPEGIRSRKTPDEKLTKFEFLKTFHQQAGGALEYEFTIVKAELDSVEGERRIKWNIDGKDYFLRLVPVNMSESVIPLGTPIMAVKTIKGKSYNYRHIVQTDERHDGSSLFEDRHNMATILLHTRDGIDYYDGVFGEGKDMKVIRSAPARFAIDYGAGNHFIYKINGLSGHDDISNENNANSAGELQEPLNSLYPEFIVVVDHSLYKNLNENLLESMKYLTVFWNAVNLKYRSFTKPRVHIKITGIILSKDDTALKYVHDSKEKHDKNMVTSTKILVSGGMYFANYFRRMVLYKSYDATVTMASLNEEGGVLGKAYIGGICSRLTNIGYVQDFGTYGGVLVATHEIGHMLKIEHDEDNCNRYNDENTASIMAKTHTTITRVYAWSKCSLESLEKFAKSSSSACLKNHM